MNMNFKKRLFVSYAREDSERICGIIAGFKWLGHSVFQDTSDIPLSAVWEDEIERAIRNADGIALFWSIHASNSDWVRREYQLARELSKSIAPFLLDKTPLPDEVSCFQATHLYQVDMAPTFRNPYVLNAPHRPEASGAEEITLLPEETAKQRVLERLRYLEDHDPMDLAEPRAEKTPQARRRETTKEKESSIRTGTGESS